MSSSSSDLMGFYKILLPLPDSALSIQYLPLYFTENTRFPKYQFKYYKMKGYHIPDEFLCPAIIESLTPNAILLETTQEKDFFPIFRLMSSSEFDECFEFFSKNSSLNNFYYTLGSIYEKRLDYVKSKDFFQHGCDHGESFSILKMIKIVSEPLLAEKYQMKQDLTKTLKLTLENFLLNGFFDCFTPNLESFHGLYLFYLYLDCFPELNSIAQKQSLTNPLLKLLLTLEWKNPEVYLLMQEIEKKFPENFFLLGDLYHPKMLGVNIETEFNKMQEKYTKTLRTNNQGWLKVACLNEGFLNHELKRLTKSKAPNQILEESIRKINKNIDTAYKRLESFPEFACSFELLHYQASNSNKKALEFSHLENYRKLSKFGDETILRVFFKVLKFHYKKLENSGSKQEIAQELFLIASKIAHIDHEFREAPLAFCFEKGLGSQKNFPAAFNLYRDLLKKIIMSGFEIHFFCYRFASLLKGSTISGFEDAAVFFFQVAYWSLMSSINEDDYNGFYELGKFYLKGRGIEANEAYALKIYENLLRNVKEKKRDSLNDQILIQSLNRKISKIKKTGPSVIKNNNDTENLKDFINNERKNSNKTIKNWPIYKTLSSGSSVSTEIMNALNNLNEKFKSLNPNIEELQSKIYLPYAKPSLSIIGHLKPKEMRKDSSEVPKWKASMKNSIKMKREELISHVKETLGKYLHFFELKEMTLNFTEPKHIGNHALYPALLKHNNQVFSMKIVELGDSQEIIMILLEKLEVYCKINSPYFLNIIAFTVDSTSEKANIYLFYETFTEKLNDFLEQNETNPQISQKCFYWIIFIVQTFQNSGFLLSYLTENNFVIAKTLIPKFADFDFEILTKTPKQTIAIDPAKSMNILQFAQYAIPPELLYGFMKSNKSTLSIGSVIWSLGTIGFWIFGRRRLFEGVEVKTYEDFKTFYNQEKIFARIESFIIEEWCKTLLKMLLNMNQQERTNLNLQQVLSTNANGIVEFPNESYLTLNGFLYANFMEIDTKDQEIFLGNKEYFRGECLGSLPNGKCQFNSNNLSMKGEFSKGKFMGNGEIFNSLTSSILEVNTQLGSGSFKSKLVKLSLIDDFEIPITISPVGLNLDEKLFEKFTSGFISNEEASWTSNIDLEEQMKWEIITKYLISYKNFNKNPQNKLFCIDNLMVHWNNSPDDSISEFILIKSHYISPFFIVYDEKISPKNIFYCSLFSFGLFQLATKPNFRNPIVSLFQNINGIKLSYPGIKEMGIFSDFDLQKGVKIKDFQIGESFDISKKVVFSRINDAKEKEKFEGLRKNLIKWYYGIEIYSNLNKYEGGFENGKLSGKGVLTDSEGKILFKGYFSNGLPTWGLFYKEKNKKYEGIFKQIDGFHSEFQVKSIENLLENFEVHGTYLSPEEKIIATFGAFNLKEPILDLTGNFHLVYDSLNEYEGFLEQGVKRGVGSYIIKKDGNVHISIKGYWEANKVKAVIRWDSQNSFEKSVGNFSFNDNGNYIMGDFGLLYFKNGNKYEGLLSNNKLQGCGEFQQNANGLRKSYKGQFSNSLRNGYGVLEDVNLDNAENALYKGFFLKNKKSGFGTLRINDFLLLEGIFFDNSIKFGCLFLKTHKIFDRICANLMKTQGSNTEFMPVGFGMVFFKDGRILECQVSQIITDFMNEIIGRLIFNDKKKVYQGTLKGLKPNGMGEMYRNGKLIYSGEFSEGKFHGFGKLNVGRNKELVGEFRKGMKEGFGLEYDYTQNKCVFKGYWEHGMKVKGGILKNEGKENNDEKKFVRIKNNGINQVLLDL